MKYQVEKTFSCAHFYKQKTWSPEKNQTEFGKCFSEFGHGHDYTLKIEFQSESPQEALREIEALVESLDHQHLNFKIPEFQDQIPTTENLALYIKDQLFMRFLKNSLSVQILKLRLQETPQIWVELSDFPN